MVSLGPELFHRENLLNQRSQIFHQDTASLSQGQLISCSLHFHRKTNYHLLFITKKRLDIGSWTSGFHFAKFA